MSRLRWIFRPGRQQSDLTREMEAHLAERIDALIDEGRTEAEAQSQARREFGNIARQSESGREVWRPRSFETVYASVRDAVRRFHRHAGTIGTCVLVLGASTGLFVAPAVIADCLVLRPIRLPGIDRVVSVGGLTAPPGWSWSQWWDQAASLEAFTRWQAGLTELTTAEGSFLVNAAYVDSGFPGVFPVRPVLGRALEDRDFLDGLPVPVVINDATWDRRFHRDAGILGQTIALSGVPIVVVGILPTTEAFRHDVQVWVPRPAGERFAVGRQTRSGAHARLVQGASVADARREVQALGMRLNSEFTPKTGTTYFGTFTLTTVTNWIARPFRLPVLALLVGALAILVMAALNAIGLLSNLVLDRRHDLAVRTSLGATRGRLLGQAGVESLLLGGSAGLLGGSVGVGLLVLARPLLDPISPFPGRAETLWAAMALGVALGATVGLLAGLIPMWQFLAGRDSRLLNYRGAERGSRRGRPFRTVTAVAQLALAMSLVTVASAAVQTFRASRAVSLGFEPASVLGLRLMTPAGVSAQEAIDVIAANATTAGLVESYATTERLPVADPGGMIYVGPENLHPARVLAVGPGFFRVMGIPRLIGRELDSRDTEGIVVSASLARELWGTESAVGRMLDLTPSDKRLVVGVVGDVREDVVDDETIGRAAIYTLLSGDTGRVGAGPQRRTLLMRCARDCHEVIAPLSAIIESAGSVPVDVIPLQTAFDQKVVPSRLGSGIATGGGVLGVVLALASVFGVVRQVEAARLREMAIRMALGATPRMVRGLVAHYGIGLLAGGLAIGSCTAWLLLSVGRSLWYGSTPSDPINYLVAALTLASGGCFATLGPIVRLGRLNPQTLRGE